MAERHPDELDLLDLVEGELPRAAQDSVAAHVEACTECGAAVRRLRAGRSALHASGVLQLSERARDRVTEAIDGEPRLRAHRFRYFEPRRLGVVLAATLVLVASVVAVAQWGGVGGTGEEGAGGDAVADFAEGGGQERAEEDGEAETAVPEAMVRVAGPARTVAADLRAEGFDARVEGGEVVVRLTEPLESGAESPEADRLQAVLAERPPGRVTVRVEPAG